MPRIDILREAEFHTLALRSTLPTTLLAIKIPNSATAILYDPARKGKHKKHISLSRSILRKGRLFPEEKKENTHQNHDSTWEKRGKTKLSQRIQHSQAGHRQEKTIKKQPTTRNKPKKRTQQAKPSSSNAKTEPFIPLTCTTSSSKRPTSSRGARRNRRANR